MGLFGPFPPHGAGSKYPLVDLVHIRALYVEKGSDEL